MSHLVIDSEHAARNRAIAGRLAQKEQRDAEVTQSETRAKEAATPAPESPRGIALTSDTIIQRLTRLNRNLHIEPSINDPNILGVYLLDPLVGSGKRFLVGFNRGVNTEFTTKELNQDGSLKRIIPGWRRVLMRLIRAKAITESAANVMFGPPNADSANWQMFVT